MADRVRPRFGPAASLAVAGALLTTTACSVAIPLPAFVDRVPTGSLSGQHVAVWSALDAEDLRRANAAMAVALDPQGNGEAVAWDNPKSGLKGSFAAAAAAYPEQDRICRRFNAKLITSARPDQRVAGKACRDRDGAWTLADLAQRK